MPNIKPISDLRNYTEVLHDVAVGSPVFLTKNGRGKYAILDMQDYEKAATYIPDNTLDVNAKTVLITCLEKNIENAFKLGREATCRTIIKRLQALQADNPCAREYLEKLDAPPAKP